MSAVAINNFLETNGLIVDTETTVKLIFEVT